MTERVLGSLGLGPGETRGYAAYIEGRVLELGSKAGRKQLAAEWKGLRRGWYVGGERFLAKLEKHLERAVAGRKRESHSGPAKAAHDEAGAEQLLAAGLRAIGLSEAALAGMPKGAAPKVVRGWWLRQRTAVPLRWVSERLAMGHYTRVTQAVSRMQRRPGRELQRLRRKLERLPAQGEL